MSGDDERRCTDTAERVRCGVMVTRNRMDKGVDLWQHEHRVRYGAQARRGEHQLHDMADIQ